MNRFLFLTVLFSSVLMLFGCGGGGGNVVSEPVANAGPDRVVRAGLTGISVTLDGSSSSFDADGDTLTYQWSFSSIPSGSSVALSDASTVNPAFTPDKDGDYILSLVVNNGTVDSVQDQVTITIQILRLPDTGQTTSYTNTFGEDADYNINPPSYTDNDDGTVTDNVTGLMWQQNDDNNTYNWYQASGTTNVTNNPSTTDVCGSLTLGGYSNWRLPSKKELMSIVDYGTYAPAIDTVFPGTNAGYYWSSTTYAFYWPNAWCVNFYYFGNVYYFDKSDTSDVRCVR